MKKPSLIQVVCLIQLVVTALLAVIVSLRDPSARGPIINLVLVACAAITGLQAANSSIARKISIGLNMFEVLFLTPILIWLLSKAQYIGDPDMMIFVTDIRILFAVAIIVPCAISAFLLIRMHKTGEKISYRRRLIRAITSVLIFTFFFSLNPSFKSELFKVRLLLIGLGIALIDAVYNFIMWQLKEKAPKDTAGLFKYECEECLTFWHDNEIGDKMLCPECGGNLLFQESTNQKIDRLPCDQSVEVSIRPSIPTGFVSEQVPTSPAMQKTARIEKKGEFFGVGALVQGIGLVCCFRFFSFGIGFGVSGIFVGLILLLVGGRMAIKQICSECKNQVEKTSRMCPTCKAVFQ